MYKGTTPTIVCDINIDTTQISALYATFVQKEQVMFEKNLTDGVTVSGDKVNVTLSQEDTNKLTPGITLEMQLKFKLKDGTVHATNIATFTVHKTFKEGAI